MLCTRWSFCDRFAFECFVPNVPNDFSWKHLPTKLLISLCWHILWFFETFTVINSVTRNLLIKTVYKFKTIKCWFTLYFHMHVLGYYKFKCFVYPTSLSRVSHSIDICTVAIENIRNMQAVSTNQIADILHFSDKQ